MKRELNWVSAVVIGTVGCSSGGLDDPRHQTGSQTIVASSNYSALYVSNTDEGTVTRLNPTTGDTDRFEVGREPTRIARAKDRVFVTLRSERAVAVLNESGSTLVFETKIQVGAEPFGVVASEKGDRVYVASSLSHRVDEIDVDGLTVLRSWATTSEPRWLALHPSGKALYVGSPYAPGLSWIDLDSDAVQAVALPEQSTFAGSPLTARITGDMAVSPSGYEMAAPALYVDNVTPIDDTIPPPATGYYGSATQGGGRLTPVLVVIPTSNLGEPLADYGFALLISGRDIGGYPASAVFDPNGETIYAPLEAGGGVVATTLNAEGSGDNNPLSRLAGGSGSSTPFGFPVNPIQTVRTPAGPRSIAFLEKDRAFAHSFIDHQIADIRAGEVAKALESSDGGLFGTAPSFDTRKTFVVSDQVLPDDVAYGRRLFYSNDDTRIASPLSGLSCSACHFDGRNDGLTWTFTKGGRQTPSLAGKVSLTEPVRWQGDRATVQEDALRTSMDAMGGGGFGSTSLSPADLDAIAAFVDWTRDADVAPDQLDPASVARGQAIFERPDVACASCHAGPRYTDNRLYDMLGIRGVKTRPLTGVAATAPYFHDGSASTLMDVLERGRDGSMGNTSMLSEQEMHDLAEYLRSL